MNHFILPLSGLHCMGCVRKVERSLKEQYEVSIHHLTTENIELETKASLQEIISTIKDLGFQAGESLSFHLEGLRCGKCVSKLSGFLASSGQHAEIQLSKERLSLITTLSPAEIQAQITALGFTAIPETETPDSNAASVEIHSENPPASQEKSRTQNSPEITKETPDTMTATFLIQGMTCASCVSSVEKSLSSVPGVLSVRVNLAEQSAEVSGNTSVEIPDLLNAVQTAGYGAEHIDDLTHQQTKQQQYFREAFRKHKINAIQGLLLGVPLMLWGVLGGTMTVETPQQQIGWGVVGCLCLLLLMTAGRNFFLSAWQSLKHRRATMDTLVALGTGTAWLYSIIVVLFPQWFIPQARHVYFEASAMIIGLISLGHAIEVRAKSKTNQSLQALIDLQPQQATVITEQGDQRIDVSKIQKGMSVRIKPGEKVPVDGLVTEGESYLTESMLTGEPLPVFKSSGETVAAGTFNHDGSLVITATGIGSNTMLSRIIRIVRRAQSSKPPMAKMADQIAAVFVPVVVLIAAFSAFMWYLFGPAPQISHMLVAATTVLIIACPCALGLATPLSVTVGIGKAAAMGILIRDADVLQTAGKIDTVVFDKTGTLTEGKPQIQHIEPIDMSEDELLSVIYAIEKQSDHPLAKAICDYALERQVSPAEVEQFANLSGRGLSGTYQGKTVHIGSLQHIQTLNISLERVQERLEQAEAQAWTPILVSVGSEIKGILSLSDQLKPDSVKTIEALKALNINTVMLTGDHHAVAEHIARQSGIEQVFSQVLPDQKADYIARLQKSGRQVAMIGDGINDAPALAQANLGIAMGNGSDIAIESAQITFLHNSPLMILNTIKLSKAVLRNIKQNLTGAFFYNTLGIPVAAGALYPLFGFLLNPVIAGAAMALSSITVVSNANRLHRFQPLYEIEKNSDKK